MRLTTHQIWQIYGSYENVYYFIFFFSYFSKSVEGGAEAPSAPPPERALKRGTVETSPQRPSRGHKKVAVVGRQGCNYDKVLLGK